MNELEYIKDFLARMRSQDNRSTASPFYYVIRTKVEDVAPIDACDVTKVYWNDSTYDSVAELRKSCEDDGYTEPEIEQVLEEAHEYGIRYRWECRGMFLTESDAKEHLRLNHYHYSPDAHDYVKHAWRAPELKRFFDSLHSYFEVAP